MAINDISCTSALITDIDKRKALPIIRALGQENVRIIGISHYRSPMCGFSKYCSKVYRCPDYRVAPNAFLEFLKKICESEKPDVLYPIEDVVLSLCTSHPAYWKPYTHALFSNSTALELSYDKWKTIQAAEKLNIPVPKSYCPESQQDIIDIVNRGESEYVIKPRKSSGSRGLKYVTNISQLTVAYNEVAKEYPNPIIQERIPQSGAGVGISVLLAQDQSVLAVFGHKRLREYPITGGPSTLRQSFRDDELIQQSLDLLKNMGYVGIAMVEYKFDQRSGKYVLMEVNPRFWGSLQLAIHAGVNFPVLYHKASLDIKVTPVLDYPTDVYCRWLLPGDILHFIANPKRFHLRPSFFEFRHPKLAYDIISTDDPWPMLGIFIESFRKLLSNKR